MTELSMNYTQRRTFDELLAVGMTRPSAVPHIAEKLRGHIENGTKDALARWPERSLWTSKGQLFSVLRCEGGYLADKEKGWSDVVPIPVVVGLITHRAIQIAYTHGGLSTDELIEEAIAGCREVDQKIETFYNVTSVSVQSDVKVQALSRLLGFIDSWPPLHPSWTPRFEEPIQAKIGKLTLSGRVDLLLGRSRDDGRQTMLIADWKTGGLKDEHADEAALYALIATLRFGVPPFRSVIYSLASGEWTEPDVTEESLFASAQQVVDGINAMVDVSTAAREATLTPSGACSWCPARLTCPAVNLDGETAQ